MEQTQVRAADPQVLDVTQTLFVIATPIGHLRDISLRALDTLAAVDLIAAEDMRHSRKLLQHYGIRVPMVSFHDHNKSKQAPGIISKLQQGANVGLISDAGTPGISDPGFYLIREAIRENLNVVPVPGATALIPALVLSGLPVHRFVFEGFPPAKKGRKTFFESLQHEGRTIILYESPYRVLKTLRDIRAFWGNRHVAVVRELTKRFEECLRGPVDELLESMAQRPVKGEFVLVIQGHEPD